MLCLSNIITQIAVARMLCVKKLYSHMHSLGKKMNVIQNFVIIMIQDFDEQLPERDNDIIKIFLLLSAQI